MAEIEIIDYDKTPNNSTVGVTTNSTVNRLSEMMIKGFNNHPVDKNLSAAVYDEVVKQNPTTSTVPVDSFVIKEIEGDNDALTQSRCSKEELRKSLLVFRDFLNNSRMNLL